MFGLFKSQEEIDREIEEMEDAAYSYIWEWGTAVSNQDDPRLGFRADIWIAEHRDLSPKKRLKLAKKLFDEITYKDYLISYFNSLESDKDLMAKGEKNEITEGKYDYPAEFVKSWNKKYKNKTAEQKLKLARRVFQSNRDKDGITKHGLIYNFIVDTFPWSLYYDDPDRPESEILYGEHTDMWKVSHRNLTHDQQLKELKRLMKEQEEWHKEQELEDKKREKKMNDYGE